MQKIVTRPTMNPVVLGSSSIFLYLVSSVLLALRLWRRDLPSLHGKLPLLLPALLAAALHAGVLYEVVADPQGLNLVFFNALSAFGWIIVLILLVMSIRAPVETLGIGLMPIAALTVLGSLVFGGAEDPVEINDAAQLHILISMLAYSLLSFAAMQAVLLAIQLHYLHNHHPGGFVRALPPLAVMETMLFQLIAVGFVLLTLSLLSGFVYLENMFAQQLVHKTALSILAWAVFGVLLAGRRRYGWRGKVAVRWTLSGIALLLLAYFGSKLVLELILGR